jgi:hypothetical protein
MNPMARRLRQFQGQPVPYDEEGNMDPNMAVTPPMTGDEGMAYGPPMEMMDEEMPVSPYGPGAPQAMPVHSPESFRKEYGRRVPPEFEGLTDTSPMDPLHLGQHKAGRSILRQRRQEKVRQLSAIRERLNLALRNAAVGVDTRGLQSQIAQMDAMIRAMGSQAEQLEQEPMQP